MKVTYQPCEAQYRVPRQALEQRGNPDAVAHLETDNILRNAEFWIMQPFRCAVNETNGVPEWDWTGVVDCELRGCNLTEPMRHSPNLQWNTTKGYTGPEINISTALLVPAYTEVLSQCPKGEKMYSKCGTFMYTARWVDIKKCGV